MRVLYDIDIPIIGEYFSSHNIESQPFVGRSLTNDFLRLYKPDSLFIRSTTKIDETLLNGVPISFIGTATSGTDHVDENFTAKEHIHTASAKGSNANAVAEYIISCLLELKYDKGIEIKNKTIGIIGYGNVGQRLAVYAEKLGLHVIVNDPPRKENNGIFHHNYADLYELLSESDIISLHIPFIDKGVFTTRQLLNDEKISLLKQNAIIMNAARGNLIDEQTLIQSHNSKKNIFIIDTWTNEPNISLEFAKKCYVSTPHIAGYSIKSKKNAAYAILSQWLKYHNVYDEAIPNIEFDISNSDVQFKPSKSSEHLLSNTEILLNSLRATRSLIRKSVEFRDNIPSDEGLIAPYFDQTRKNSIDNEETLSLVVKE